MSMIFSMNLVFYRDTEVTVSFDMYKAMCFVEGKAQCLEHLIADQVVAGSNSSYVVCCFA